MNPSVNILVRHTIALAALQFCAANAMGQVQNTTTTIHYAADSTVYRVQDGLLHDTYFEYDALTRRKKQTDAAGATFYEYDGLDQLTKVTDARNVATVYTIDGHGNLNQTTSGDTGATINTYDENGNLRTRTDAKLQKTTYSYDALNRALLITYSDNTTTAYQYDQGVNAVGRLSRITDNLGTIQYEYSQHGRLAKETRVIGGTTYVTAYRYNSVGQLEAITYPSGRSIEYGYDALGRVAQISAKVGAVSSPVVTAVSYQPFGPIKSVTFGNGQTQLRSHDLDGRLATYSLGSTVMELVFDAASRITSIGEKVNVNVKNTYTYDDVDRLKTVVTPTAAQSYAYDAVGNRIQKTTNGSTNTLTYAPTSNRLTNVGSQAIATDANGSITNKGNASFNFDARGRMVSANTSIGLVQYQINSLGQRVRKITPTETTVFHYDAGGKLIAETTTAGSVVKTQEHVYLGDMPVAVLK